MTNLADYQLAERIHEGRRHDVLRGKAPDGRPVVLKILRQLHPTPDQVARFRHEFDTLASVRSDHVVHARALETDRRRWALVQDDFGGVDLSLQLAGGALARDQLLDVAICVASALSDLHAQGVIHKDVNPSNIVRNPATGEVRLIDFGLATALTSESPTFSNRAAWRAPCPTSRRSRPVGSPLRSTTGPTSTPSGSRCTSCSAGGCPSPATTPWSWCTPTSPAVRPHRTRWRRPCHGC